MGLLTARTLGSALHVLSTELGSRLTAPPPPPPKSLLSGPTTARAHSLKGNAPHSPAQSTCYSPACSQPPGCDGSQPGVVLPYTASVWLIR